MCTRKVTFSSNKFKFTNSGDKRPRFFSVFINIFNAFLNWEEEYKEEIKLLEWVKAELAGKGLQSELVYHGDCCWSIKVMINCKEITIAAGPERSSSEVQLAICIYTVNYKPDIDMCLSWPFFKRNKPDDCHNEIERLSTKIDAILKSETGIHDIKWFSKGKGSKVYNEIIKGDGGI